MGFKGMQIECKLIIIDSCVISACGFQRNVIKKLRYERSIEVVHGKGRPKDKLTYTYMDSIVKYVLVSEPVCQWTGCSCC